MPKPLRSRASHLKLMIDHTKLWRILRPKFAMQLRDYADHLDSFVES